MSSYIDIIIKFELGFGFAFELPLIVFYLVIFDVIPYKKLRGQLGGRCYVVLMVICSRGHPRRPAGLQLLWSAAMIMLYEGSLLIARVVLGRPYQAPERGAGEGRGRVSARAGTDDRRHGRRRGGGPRGPARRGFWV